MVMVAGECVCVCVCRSCYCWLGKLGLLALILQLDALACPWGLVLLALCSDLGYWQVLGGRIAGICVDYSCGSNGRLGFLAFVCIGENALPWALVEASASARPRVEWREASALRQEDRRAKLFGIFYLSGDGRQQRMKA
jgi:hypothetical protein